MLLFNIRRIMNLLNELDKTFNETVWPVGQVV